MSWSVFKGTEGHQHVVPDQDMRRHRHSIDCWCRPGVDDLGVIVHNAMDERERYDLDQPAVSMTEQ